MNKRKTTTKPATGAAGLPDPKASASGGTADPNNAASGTKQSRVLAAGHFPRPPFGSNRFFTWSPDSKWLAYFNQGDRAFRNCPIERTDGVNVSDAAAQLIALVK